jgi:hydroxyethylthiazole kinase-like uncharacterized protein yjeF
MFPILGSAAMRAADARTIQRQGIPSWELMERAARACTPRILAHTSPQASFLIVAGIGNNGGDGLAIARLLNAEGRKVRVVVVGHRGTPSPDHQRNRSLLEQVGIPVGDQASGPVEEDVVVDCLLGTGAERVAHGAARHAIAWMAASGRPIISVDMPSGLWAEDNSGNDPDAIVPADLVLTLGAPKPALLLPENARFVKAWELVPIDLDLSDADPVGSSWIEATDVARLLKTRPRAGHKGTFGHASLVAGSARYAGAAVIAARAALRSGCGLVTLVVPDELVGTVQMAVPEAIAVGRKDMADIVGPDGVQAVGMGPGLGTHAATDELVRRVLDLRGPLPMVLDADALNMLARSPEAMARVPAGTILTPHPKEFDRMLGSACTSGYERLREARGMARSSGTIVVLKGAHTAVCLPDGHACFNSTGNNGMAKGGSGDALTGVLTGLLAQGYAPADAALIGVYLHGLAGDLAADTLGPDGMTVSDLIAHLPQAWRRLRAVLEQPLH